jgi:hypothetical protein
MEAFCQKHEAKIAGVLSCFDRMLFRGYLPIMSGASMAQFLQSERVNCENLKHFLLDTAHRLKWHAERMAAEAGRPFEYLNGAGLRNSIKIQTKNLSARTIEQRFTHALATIWLENVSEAGGDFNHDGDLAGTRVKRPCAPRPAAARPARLRSPGRPCPATGGFVCDSAPSHSQADSVPACDRHNGSTGPKSDVRPAQAHIRPPSSPIPTLPSPTAMCFVSLIPLFCLASVATSSRYSLGILCGQLPGLRATRFCHDPAQAILR